jgi:hypothetical protein
LVEKHLIQAQGTHGIRKLLEIHGLDDVTIHPQCIAGLEIMILARGGERDNGNVAGAFILLDAAEHFEPVQLWEF